MNFRKSIAVSVFLVTVLAGTSVTLAESNTPTIASLQELVANLQKQVLLLQAHIEELTSQISTTRNELVEVRAELKLTRTLRLGTTGEDVKQLQEFLKQFKDIYPEGLVTGYFGPLTEKAVQKWQAQQEIVTSGDAATTGYGQVGPKTLARVNELITEGARQSGVVPPGLLIAPGIEKKIATTTASNATIPVTISTSTLPSATTFSSATATASTLEATTTPVITPVQPPTTQSTNPQINSQTITTATTTVTTTATSTATTTLPIFIVTSPNDGEQMIAGNTYSINWVSTSTNISTVNIELYKSGNYSTSIAYNTPNSGSFSWTVPATTNVGSDYKVRVYSTMYYNSYDESNAPFSIIVPVVAPATPPIGYWKFDGNGNNEITGSPNAVTVGNAVFNASGGKFNGYLYIPTGTDSAKIPYNSRFDLPDSFTIELWFRQRSNQSFRQDLISKGSRDYYPGGNVNFWIWRQLWDQYNFGPIQASYVNRNTGYYVGVTNTNQPAHNQWHHIVYTKDSSGSEYYLDGISMYRNTDSAQAKTPAVDIIIGDTATDTDVDNIRIYNYALNRGEVLYNFAEVAPVSSVPAAAPSPSDSTPNPTSTSSTFFNQQTQNLAAVSQAVSSLNTLLEKLLNLLKSI